LPQASDDTVRVLLGGMKQDPRVAAGSPEYCDGLEEDFETIFAKADSGERLWPRITYHMAMSQQRISLD